MASNARYLTPKELATYLQVSVDYLYREVLGYQDGIPALKLGNGKRSKWRINTKDVENWEQRRRVSYEVNLISRRRTRP